MATLVIQLPPRNRLSSRADDAVPAQKLPPELEFVLSADGRTPASMGQAAPALMPKADHVVLVMADADVSWHRIEIPKAPPARLRAAQAGTMEEMLLDDDDAVHVALGDAAVPGQNGWVAVLHKPWLVAALATLESAGLTVERVLPGLTPGVAARGHFFIADPGADSHVALAMAGAEGVACLRLGGLARALLPAAGEPARYTATPAAATAAETWLGAPVEMQGAAERALEAARGTVKLRQFDLAVRHRGLLAVRNAVRGLRSPQWRPVRWGLAALVGLQLFGLNAWAWQQRQAVSDRRQALVELLRSSHPGVRAVLDAPVQMQRETDRLRTAAGRPGDADLEVLLAAAAAAWPDGQGPVQSLQFESGRLTLTSPGWSEPQLAQFRARLQSAGFSGEPVEGRIIVSRPADRSPA